MKIDVLSLFPEMFNDVFNESIIKRAKEQGLVNIKIHNFRDYSKDKHNKVDDTPYGGGCGMVLTCQPIFDCIDDIKTDDAKVILLTPDGKTYNQSVAYDLSKEKHIILICGHYEGFDERIYTLADELVSIGDFILTGGELPSMMITDSVVRLIDGVITKESLETESFNDGLLDYPVYTKPRVFRGMEVPEVLVNGNHKLINEYRDSERKRITKEYRDDLL